MGINVTNLRLFQLVVTVMFTSVVIYLYTVIAFNFFRKFYTKEEDGEKKYKCNDMLTVSNFSVIPPISSFSRRNKRYLLSLLFFPSSVSSPPSTRVCEWVVELERRLNHPM